MRPMAPSTSEHGGERLRVAVVGTGEWWGYHHARVWHGRTDAELVAIVGRSADKVAARAATFGVPGYVDLHAMLAAECRRVICSVFTSGQVVEVLDAMGSTPLRAEIILDTSTSDPRGRSHIHPERRNASPMRAKAPPCREIQD